MEPERETLTWETFGDAAQELAQVIAGDGFRPDLILAIARGGMFVAGEPPGAAGPWRYAGSSLTSTIQLPSGSAT